MCMKRNICSILDNDLCLGCGLCKAIDGKHCNMRLNARGFYVPDFEKCDKRTITSIFKICPGISISNNSGRRHSSVWGGVRNVSNAWAADPQIRQSSSSGGVTSALAIYLLETRQVDGVLHVGVEEQGYLYNGLYVSRTREDVLKRNASRYAPAAVFDDIRDIFDAEKSARYAFIGKPCDIAGLQNFIREFPEYNNRIKYYLSIFCAGMPSYNATKKVLTTFGRKDNPVSLRYRGDGWPGYFTAVYSDGKSYRMTYNESWGKILGRDLGFRCKICPDGIGLLADIASGDSWNTKDGYPDFTESDGKNFCFIRTEKGLKMFEDAERAGYINSEKLEIDTIQNMQRYQYDRRHMVGWRIAVVQMMTLGLLRFKGLGFYRTALHANKLKGLKEIWGTGKRFVKARKLNG